MGGGYFIYFYPPVPKPNCLCLQLALESADCPFEDFQLLYRVSGMTLTSSTGNSLRPDGILRDRDGVRMLTKVHWSVIS